MSHSWVLVEWTGQDTQDQSAKTETTRVLLVVMPVLLPLHSRSTLSSGSGQLLRGLARQAWLLGPAVGTRTCVLFDAFRLKGGTQAW